MASVKRTANGRWVVRYRINGKGNKRRFERKIDADRFASWIEGQKVAGLPWMKREPTTFEEFVGELGLPRASLGKSAQVRERSLLGHLLEEFEPVLLDAIDYARVQNFINRMARAYSPDTTRKTVQLLGRILDSAVASGRIERSPIRAGISVSLPPESPPRRRIFTPAGIEGLLDAMSEVEPRFRVVVALGAFGGLREGEMRNLRRSDFNPIRGELSVLENPSAGHRVKTEGSQATITIPRRLVEEVNRHLEHFPAERDDYLIRGPRGARFSPNNFRRRAWPGALELAGLTPDYTPHDLRRTAGSLVYKGTGSIKEAAGFLRNSERVASRVYVHLYPGWQREAAGAIDEMMADARGEVEAEAGG